MRSTAAAYTTKRTDATSKSILWVLLDFSCYDALSNLNIGSPNAE